MRKILTLIALLASSSVWAVDLPPCYHDPDKPCLCWCGKCAANRQAATAVADDNPFAYLELKTYAQARDKVLEGQYVFLFVGVPDPWAGGGSYVYHCRVAALAGTPAGKYFCYKGDDGRPMMRREAEAAVAPGPPPAVRFRR